MEEGCHVVPGPLASQSLARLLGFLRKRWRWVLSFAILVWGLPAALLLLLVFAPPPPSPYARLLADSTKIYDRHGRLLYEVTLPQEGSHTYLRLDEISPALRQAAIATEDASFYRNPGFDVLALGRALVQNLRAGEVVAGGSTITQQLVRNLYLSPEERSSRTVQRKVRETILAFRLTRHLSKDKILEMYLNQVYYGNLAYGVEAAAQTYFGKSARHLDLAEASLLAGLPQSPARHDPLTDLPAAKGRQADVLSLMVDAGYISDGEARAALAEPLRFQDSQFPIRAPHFVNYVRDLLAERFGADAADRGGLRVYTTLDLDLQTTAEAVVRQQVTALREHQVSNGALVALDPDTGQIRVMVGSADYFDEEIDGQVNMALAARQPGSSIKPITYAAALERGYTAATPLTDVRTAFLTRKGELYVPQNYDGTFHGLVSMRYALGSSYNVPAVQMMDQIGVDAVLRLARELGITTLGETDRFDLSLTLGGGEVRLLDLTAAYAAFAAGGLRRDPVAILRVEDAAGRLLYEWQPVPDQQVVSAQTAYILTDILADNAARTPGFGADSALRLSRPAAVKTGTTTDFHDNWTLGYTPSLVTGVWVGNADNRPMRQVSGVEGAAPIWHAFMEETLKAEPPEDFPRPDGLVDADVCEPTGLRPGPWCLTPRREVFAAGSEPTATETYYRALPVCAATGQLATASCPPERRVQRVFVFPPPEVIPWAREAGLPLAPATPILADGETAPAPDGLDGQGPRLILVSPEPEAMVEISGEIPREHQGLEVEAVAWGAWQPAVVELHEGGQLLASLRQPPYRTHWPLAEGTHVFQAVAYDEQGTRVSSQSVEVTILP
jgi:1A family penicillin-binding protein